MDTEMVEAAQMIHDKMNSDYPEHPYMSAQLTTGYIFHVLQTLDSLAFSNYRKADEIKEEAQQIYKRLNLEAISIPDNGETIYEILIVIEQIAYNKYLAAVEQIYSKESDDILTIIREAQFFTRIYKYRLGLKDQNIPRKLRKHKESVFIFEYSNLLDFCDLADSFLQRGKADLAMDALRTLIRLILFYSPYINRSPGSELVRLNFRSYWVDLNLDFILERGIEIAKDASIALNYDQSLKAQAEAIAQDLSRAREQI